MENVRSFFQREDELTKQPKGVPEAASEVLGRQTTPAARIVEKPLPKTETPPRLPFSPDDLRSALKAEVPTQSPPAPRQPQQIERDITYEIAAFEDALLTHEVAPARQPAQQATAPTPAMRAPMGDGFFNEFEQFLTREDLEADGILEKDLVFRMKEFHRHRQEGKEYYLYSKDVQNAVGRKLSELKSMEREWFEKREQTDRLEKDLAMIEHEIESRTTELKGLLKQAKAASRLERAVPEGQEFMLADGRKLRSLLDLKVALKSMPDTVFSHHVTSIKNDFGAWIRGAMDDNALADQMGAVRDKQQLELLLGRL
jgi:hypothetical protein